MLNLSLSLFGTYTLVCIGAWVLNRHFLNLPDRKRCTPREVELPEVKEITFEGRGGVKLIAWYLPTRGRKPTLLYFTGNSRQSPKCSGLPSEKVEAL